MHPQLAAIVSDLEAASGRVHALRGSLQSSGAWNTRPSSTCWSPADCVAHLNLTSAALLPRVDRAIIRARQYGQQPPARYRRDAVGWLVWQIVTPGGGLKTTSPVAFEPSAASSIETLLSEFEELQTAVVTRVREADGLPLERVTVRSPFGERLRFNLYTALALVPRHQHRHLHQAEQAVRSCSPHRPIAAA